ncbi:hypothetical protein EYF80_006865 [Liparis tanakae]|uniref:Uncharacterized protein n=1 Tax=Liparis tanakae TaxID=230148 RepID=A0A4Z2IZJ4_9TELE|nr:hypothetical protein EYF80_006865 [Liparis tanakae]
MQDEGMESAPRTQPAPEPAPPPEAAPGHRLPCIWRGEVQELAVFGRGGGRVGGGSAVRKVRRSIPKPPHGGGVQVPAQAEAVRKRRREMRGFLQLIAGEKGAGAAVLQSRIDNSDWALVVWAPDWDRLFLYWVHVKNVGKRKNVFALISEQPQVPSCLPALGTDSVHKGDPALSPRTQRPSGWRATSLPPQHPLDLPRMLGPVLLLGPEGLGTEHDPSNSHPDTGHNAPLHPQQLKYNSRPSPPSPILDIQAFKHIHKHVETRGVGRYYAVLQTTGKGIHSRHNLHTVLLQEANLRQASSSCVRFNLRTMRPV